MNKALIVVQGPTGIGKSNLSIQLAKHFNTEIISSDSRQLFKELSIGTAVPSPDELSQVPHHLIHSHSIHDDYNASRFETEALELIERLFSSHNQLIMTGGSMLYVDAVCKGIDFQPDVDPAIRESLVKDWEEKGIEHLRLKLKQLDETYYQQVDLKNPKRLIRALEVCLMTGKPYSSFRKETIKKRPFKIIKIGLNMDREALYSRINQRVDQMIAEGLEDEARKIYPFRHLNSLNTVGYKELFAHFDGAISLEKAIELIKRNTRRYARKQLTWLRKDEHINWFHPDNLDEIITFTEQQLPT
ncbi:tRNA (adenosine(37)-N6)-dimethylallyltransferase MiaA [Sunxiuqinia elliptica]|uniref:tRNA dimethylallyltransferase n=1 Tax=Sunxiuqinia elliptica TaxID=655355 RepID=A0A4R6H4P6_9BACT|nr:tRNA (adenosine(37)-N6)-dimethylallyltransferase MiaA [Sunxiuqinia elliptica]TDO03112.1 tRNA dimethylallyltransferase [Sunxiuqinia elliptica]TDO59311.1 tRNA dimethylallyltransferase [Sunxiuqinia elliptica]